jgi:hypothetical protein
MAGWQSRPSFLEPGPVSAMIDQKKLAAIHIVKRELGLPDRQYRDTLEAVAGVRSAKNLDERGFRKLMNYFARSKYYRIHPGGLTFRQKMFIRDLINQLQWTDHHFENFLKKYYKRGKIETLTKKEASKVIESLKGILQSRRTTRGKAENSG